MFDILLFSLLLIVTISIVFSRNLVVSTILMSTFSMLAALTYLMLNAPDVAITEASVGAGLSTVFIFAALSLIKKHDVEIPRGSVMLVFILLVAAVCLAYSMQNLPDFGDLNAPIHQYIAPYYIEQTKELVGIPNVVTAILASFRGYDTFGETTVIFTAALCVNLMLKEDDKRQTH